jgi:hypothetical protein
MTPADRSALTDEIAGLEAQVDDLQSQIEAARSQLDSGVLVADVDAEDPEPVVIIDAATMTREEVQAATIAKCQAEIDARRLADLAAHEEAFNG